MGEKQGGKMFCRQSISLMLCRPELRNAEDERVIQTMFNVSKHSVLKSSATNVRHTGMVCSLFLMDGMFS
jgi:hypothetical protein